MMQHNIQTLILLFMYTTVFSYIAFLPLNTYKHCPNTHASTTLGVHNQNSFHVYCQISCHTNMRAMSSGNYALCIINPNLMQVHPPPSPLKQPPTATESRTHRCITAKAPPTQLGTEQRRQQNIREPRMDASLPRKEEIPPSMQAQVSYKLQMNSTKIWSNSTCMNNRGDHITLKRPHQCPIGTRAYRQARNQVTHNPLFPTLTSAGRHPSSRRRIQQPRPPGRHPNSRWRIQQPRPPAAPQTKRNQETWKEHCHDNQQDKRRS